jgi:hypothetical protein
VRCDVPSDRLLYSLPYPLLPSELVLYDEPLPYDEPPREPLPYDEPPREEGRALPPREPRPPEERPPAVRPPAGRPVRSENAGR